MSNQMVGFTLIHSTELASVEGCVSGTMAQASRQVPHPQVLTHARRQTVFPVSMWLQKAGLCCGWRWEG